MVVAFNPIAALLMLYSCCKVWEGRFLRTGSVGDTTKTRAFKAALGLRKAASQASQPGLAAIAAEHPSADGGGGGGTGASRPPAADGGVDGGGAGIEALVIELTRKISAMKAKTEKLEQRNGILEESIQNPNSKFASL